jgi:glycosyltransferase involved in cell wall biosynthesis
LPPFIDAAHFQNAKDKRQSARAWLAAEAGLDAQKTWLLAVAMMRPGDKLESYRRLGRALGILDRSDWQLVIVGDGAARDDVEAALAPLAPAVRFLGARDWNALPSIHAACDIFVWPAANEAYGMALLEAQAAGLPVVAGRVRGVPDIVVDGETGSLVPDNNAGAFASAVRRLIDDKAARGRLALNAARFIAAERDLPGAARILNQALTAART